MTSPPRDKFHLSNVTVVAEWKDANREVRFLGQRTALTLDARLDVASHTASFKLRSIASLKSSNDRVPLYLFIQPDRITALAEDDGPPQQPVKDGLIHAGKCRSTADILRLRFTLAEGALLDVGPADAGSPPQPRTSPSARILDALRSLRRATILTLSLPRKNIKPSFLEALCTHANGAQLKPLQGEVASLYSGKGGKPLEWIDDDLDNFDPLGRGESPPSYDELGPSPPCQPARKRLQSARSSPERDEPPHKRRERSAAGDPPSVGFVAQDWSRGIDERILALTDQLETLKKAVSAMNGEPRVPAQTVSTRLAKLEGEMAALRAEVAVANTKLQEISDKLCEQTDLDDLRHDIMEDVEARLAETRDEIVEETELKIEERMITAKEDLRETVEEEVENAEARIKDRLENGTVGVYFEFQR